MFEDFNRRDWLDRLRQAAIILIVLAAILLLLATTGRVAWGVGLFVLVSAMAAALVPWHLNRPLDRMTRETVVDVQESSIAGALIDSLPMPSVLLDRAGRIVHYNPLMMPLAPSMRRGEPAQYLLRAPEFVTALRRAMSERAEQRAQYVEHVPRERWTEVVITPIHAPASFSGSEFFFLMTFHDQTAFRLIDAMRADFVANVSHELRTPLAALSGFIDTLQGSARDDAKARERFLGIMRAQAARMARLIDDLLSLSRIEQKAHVDPQTMVDVAAIGRQVVDSMESLARERNVVVTARFPSTPIMVRGDRDELFRMVENLVENALKYGASGGRVEVDVAVTPSTHDVAVSVRDFGPGIAPEHLPRLTERFYRVDVGESRALGGTGLGLSLVKHILNRHRGRLMIDSTPGQGATFTASLPIGLAGSAGS